MNRYQQLAEAIKQQIKQKTWRVGEKIPSLRAASKSYSVSSSTVLHAYQLLEAQGWIKAKPQSGYFVCVRSEKRLSFGYLSFVFIAWNSLNILTK